MNIYASEKTRINVMGWESCFMVPILEMPFIYCPGPVGSQLLGQPQAKGKEALIFLK